MSRYAPGVEFGTYVARYYTQKQQQCRDRGIAFNLSLTQVKNMLRAKKCQLTGVALTHTNAGKNKHDACQRPTDVTIDRIDSSKPYEKGNVAAVAHFANQFKGNIEREYGSEAVSIIHTMSKNLKKKGF